MDELVKRYFDILYNDVLGSQAERMCELGYDEMDIKERTKYEKEAKKELNKIEKMLLDKGIDVWK